MRNCGVSMFTRIDHVPRCRKCQRIAKRLSKVLTARRAGRT